MAEMYIAIDDTVVTHLAIEQKHMAQRVKVRT
jgi:hypothetical protein